jgi:hypothetical protein
MGKAVFIEVYGYWVCKEEYKEIVNPEKWRLNLVRSPLGPST